MRPSDQVPQTLKPGSGVQGLKNKTTSVGESHGKGHENEIEAVSMRGLIGILNIGACTTTNYHVEF